MYLSNFQTTVPSASLIVTSQHPPGQAVQRFLYITKSHKRVRTRGKHLIVKQPAHVTPPEALVRGVRVHGGICVQMVIPMTARPFNWVPLHVAILSFYQQH